MTSKPSYRNKLEAKVAGTLPDRFAYETQKLSYTIPHYYLPDFIDTAAKEIIEVKGRFTASDRQKMKAVAKAHPDYTITIAFQNPDTKISKASKTSYADWCTANGIKWTRA